MAGFFETIALGPLADVATDLYHKFTGIPTEDEKRNQMKLMNEQMKAYKDQTELTRQAINEKRNAEQIEKRRIEEKQIRSLRRNYSSQGFLGGNTPTQPDMTSDLGG